MNRWGGGIDYKMDIYYQERVTALLGKISDFLREIKFFSFIHERENFSKAF